jgi:hypothetical protein
MGWLFLRLSIFALSSGVIFSPFCNDLYLTCLSDN